MYNVVCIELPSPTSTSNTTVVKVTTLKHLLYGQHIVNTEGHDLHRVNASYYIDGFIA